eukprot:1160626-Pelagomonas_calceolata.AAC.1
METASWEDGITDPIGWHPMISPVCARCSWEQIQDDAHVLFMCRGEGLLAVNRFDWRPSHFCNLILDCPSQDLTNQFQHH